jgi:hypothetical protein
MSWWQRKRQVTSRGRLEDKTVLLFGVHPAEDPTTKMKGLFEMPNVFLLDYHYKEDGHNYSRYLNVNWCNIDELNHVIDEYKLKGKFDQMSFDWSTTCSFTPGQQSTEGIFYTIGKMLKNEGILFIPCTTDYEKGLKDTLHAVGFETEVVPLIELKGTALDLLKLSERGVRDVLVGIKRDYENPGYQGAASVVRRNAAGGVNEGGGRSFLRKHKIYRRKKTTVRKTRKSDI